MHQDGSGFMQHQPCNDQTVLKLQKCKHTTLMYIKNVLCTATVQRVCFRVVQKVFSRQRQNTQKDGQTAMVIPVCPTKLCQGGCHDKEKALTLSSQWHLPGRMAVQGTFSLRKTDKAKSTTEISNPIQPKMLSMADSSFKTMYRSYYIFAVVHITVTCYTMCFTVQ